MLQPSLSTLHDVPSARAVGAAGHIPGRRCPSALGKSRLARALEPGARVRRPRAPFGAGRELRQRRVRLLNGLRTQPRAACRCASPVAPDRSLGSETHLACLQQCHRSRVGTAPGAGELCVGKDHCSEQQAQFARTSRFQACGSTDVYSPCSSRDLDCSCACSTPCVSWRVARSAHEDAVAAVRLAPRPRRLLTASWDATVKLWDMAEGRAFSQGVSSRPASPRLGLDKRNHSALAVLAAVGSRSWQITGVLQVPPELQSTIVRARAETYHLTGSA